MPPSPARSSKTTGPLREGLSARTRGLPSSSRRHDFARLWNQMASRVGSNNLVPRPRGRRQSRRLPHGRARSLSRQSKTTRNEKTFPPQLASNARSSRAEGFQYTRDFDFWHYSDRLLAVLWPIQAIHAPDGPDIDHDGAPAYTISFFHHSAVDSIILYNGQLTVPIPIGPSYPVGPKRKFQALVTYNSRTTHYWHPALWY